MKKKMKYAMCFAVVFGMVLLTMTNCVSAHKNMQRIAGNYEIPGFLETKHPANDCSDEIDVIVYTRSPDYVSQPFNIKMRISADGGANWGLVKTINPKSANQLYPDVCVVKIDDGNDVKDHIFVTWQEWDDQAQLWKIWVRDYTASGTDANPNGPATIISEHEPNGVDHARYPRICGEYLPELPTIGQTPMYSTSMVFLTYQQRGQTDAQQEIREHYYYYDANPNANTAAWSPALQVTPFVPEHSSGDGYHHPSIECAAKYVNGVPNYQYEIVCDFKDWDAGFHVYSCGFTRELVTRNQLNSLVFSGYTTLSFNTQSTQFAYPDVALRWIDEDFEDTIVYQTDDNEAYAWSQSCDPTSPYDTIDLGDCKSATMRGISVDVVEGQYVSGADTNTIGGWINPGGITVVWRSGVINPETQNTYGIDANNLEIKDGNLRISHVYRVNGEDDSDPGVSYDASEVSHHTTNSGDRYLDISTIPWGPNELPHPNHGESHVTWYKNREVWYFTRYWYHVQYWV